MQAMAQAKDLKHMLTMMALFLVLFLDGFGQTFILPVLTQALLSDDGSTLVTGWAMNKRELLYGAIIGVYYICWMFGAAVLGDLSDSYGRKKALLICVLGIAIGTLLMAFAFAINNVWLIVIGRATVGLAAGSQAIAQAAIADMSAPEHQARNTGYILLAVTLGAILGPLYGQVFSDTQLIPWVTDQTPFYGVALLSLFSVAVLLAYYHDKYQPDHRPIRWTRVIDIFKDAFQHSQIRKLLMASFGIFVCWSVYFYYMPVYLVKHFDASGWDISIFMTMYGIGASIGMAILPSQIEKHFTTKQGVIGGWGLMAFALLLSHLSPWIEATFVLVIFGGMGIGVGFLFLIKEFSSQVAQDKQGWIMGIFSASWVGTLGVTTFFSGYIANFGIAIPFIVGYILFLIAVISFIKFKKPKVVLEKT